jgi:hypothetical protein
MKKILLALILLFPLSVRADNFNLTWDAVTLGTDGQPVVGLLGYKVYVSSTSGSYTTVKATSATNTATITQIGTGKYYAVVRAYNAVGESANSNEISFVIVDKVPAPPVGFKIVP